MKTTMKTIVLVFTSVLLIAGLAFGQGSGAIAPNWYPDDGTRVLVYRALSTGNGTTTLAFSELIGKNFTFDGYFAYVIRDHGGGTPTGALPQNECREITDFSGTTGVITVGTAFTDLAAGDIVVIANRPELQVLFGTFGVPYVTAVEFGAGVSIAEGLADIDVDGDSSLAIDEAIRAALMGAAGYPGAITGAAIGSGVNFGEGLDFLTDTALVTIQKVDSIEAEGELIRANTDSILFYIHSTTGMPAVTGAFPAAGVSLSEKVQFLADSLRKVAVSTDSTLFYLHSTTGAPAVTGAFPAAGLSINERIQYLADSLRKVAVTTDTVYSYLLTATGAQWGTPTEPANGVNLFEGLGFTQNQLDSIVGALYGDVGLQWGTAAVPANGVAIDEVIRKISDAVAGANDFNRWEEPVRVVINFDAAGPWEEAATTHEVFTFTGGGDFEITGYCSTDVAVTSADSIFFISEGGGSIYRALGSDMDAGEGLFWGVQGTTGTPIIPTATVLDGDVGGVIRGHIEMGRDWGFDIDDNDFTGGIIVLECRFRPSRTGSTVVAGTGSGL